MTAPTNVPAPDEIAALRDLVCYVHTQGCKAMQGPTLLARDCDCRVRLAKSALAKLEAHAAHSRFELTAAGRAALAEPEVEQ